jgi:hypothetical protein
MRTAAAWRSTTRCRCASRKTGGAYKIFPNRMSGIRILNWTDIRRRSIMHLSPLFSSKKIVFKPAQCGLFFRPNSRLLLYLGWRLRRRPYLTVWTNRSSWSPRAFDTCHAFVTIAPYTGLTCNTRNRYAWLQQVWCAGGAAHQPVMRLLARSWVVPITY